MRYIGGLDKRELPANLHSRTLLARAHSTRRAHRTMAKQNARGMCVVHYTILGTLGAMPLARILDAADVVLAFICIYIRSLLVARDGSGRIANTNARCQMEFHCFFVWLYIK